MSLKLIILIFGLLGWYLATIWIAYTVGFYKGFVRAKKKCDHKKTYFLDEPWPTGETIEVCDDCGMSRSHWEWGESGWIMIADLPQAREDLQKSLNKITKENP